MKPKAWLTFLFFEILTALVVVFLFQTFDRQIAGLIAGFIFGLLGLVIGVILLRTRTLISFTFWWLFVYLFYSVLPMIVNRIANWGEEFSSIKIWGMAGAEFHRVSEKIYLVLIVATLLDLALAWIFSKKKAK